MIKKKKKKNGLKLGEVKPCQEEEMKNRRSEIQMRSRILDRKDNCLNILKISTIGINFPSSPQMTQ